jgi:NifU-like protein involved in Fe-S cluster formation
MEYSPEVERRLRSPERVGVVREPASPIVTGEAEDRSLNVWIRYQVGLHGGAIDSVRYEAYGCPHFVAAADWHAEQLEGRPSAALAEPDTRGVREALGVPTEKLGKLLVIENALVACATAVVA